MSLSPTGVLSVIKMGNQSTTYSSIAPSHTRFGATSYLAWVYVGSCRRKFIIFAPYSSDMGLMLEVRSLGNV